MINFFLKYKMRHITSSPPTTEDIRKSRKILFSIFTRYGDTIIDLVVIKEFIECYPEKEYLILCPKQMKPYVSEFLPNTECIALNKRNMFEMIKVDKLLKKRMFNIGFNPWSNGERVFATATNGTATCKRMIELAEGDESMNARLELFILSLCLVE